MRLRIARVLATLVLLVYPLGAGALLLTADGWSVNRLNVHVWYQVTGFFGLRDQITPEQFADIANVALFVPLFAALAVLLPTWWWVLLGTALSVGVETYQNSLGGSRTSSAIDVVTNTLGAAIGVLIGRVIHRVLRAQDLRARDLTPARSASAAPAAIAPTTPGASPRAWGDGRAGSPDDRG